MTPDPMHPGYSGPGGCADFRRTLTAALSGAPDFEALAPLAWHEHLVGCDACRLLLQREEALEVLLASLPAPALPPDLTSRVLAALSAAEGDPLDRLIELARPVDVPAGLAARVQAGVEAELAVRHRARFRLLAGPRVRVAAAAAVLVGGLYLWKVGSGDGEEPVPEELLANMSVLEDALELDPTVLDALSIDPASELFIDLLSDD